MSESKANIGPKIVLEGEAEYKQSISSVNKSMGVLKSELKAVSAEFDGNANSIEALRAKNEVLMKQQTEQEKKLSLLRGALDDANAKYGEGSRQVQEWQIKLNNAYADLSKLNNEIDSNTRNLKEAEASTDKTASSIDKYGKEVKTAGDNTETASKSIKTLSSTTVIAGVAALGLAMEKVALKTIDLVKNTASYADEILTMSAQTGITTDTLQELNYMQELTDVSLETTTKAMAKQIKSMYNAQKGTEDYVNTYKKLGVAVVDGNRALRDSDTVFWEAIDALGQMANETERDATAMLLFGKSAQDLNPLIAIGSAGVAKYAKEAQNMGAVLSGDTLSALGETDDALQRLYQQMEVSKRTIGTDMAPAMTEAIGTITEKIDEVDDKFASFAGGALENVTDGFVWMIDNVDIITAGLKGLAAAIVTKKAADGVGYVVQAYQTLTTATEVATGAQLAFNTASKANIIGLIASAVIGLGTALVTYTASAEEATEVTNRVADAYKDLSDSIDKSKESREENKKSIEAEYDAAEELANKLYELSDKEGKSNSEKQEMVALVDQLNKSIPNLNLIINEQTGLLSKERDEVDKLIASSLEYAEVQAAQESLGDIAKEKYKTEQSINDMLDERNKKQEEYNKLTDIWLKYQELNQRGYVWLSKEEKEYYNTNKHVIDQMSSVSQELIGLNVSIEGAENSVNRLGKEWNETSKYIGDHSDIDKATTALNGFLSEYKETLNQQNEAYADGLDDRVDAIEKTYESSEKALEKSLKNEKKVLEKAQKEQLKSAEDAADKELSGLEKQHKKKLDLIDEEYLEKIKLVDEDRYNKLKNIQEQIDGIDAQSEAEERAASLKEEADKRAELTAQIASAKTAEERLEAQEELADFEEETAKDRLKTERELQKDILEEQKDTINDAYDAKVKALEEAQKVEEEKAKTTYENEKIAIAERLETKKQEISDKQELETTALEEKQTAEKEAIDKQKEYAVQSAKDTYEEDLKQFKLNNALKYDEAVANEDKIKKYISEQTYGSMLTAEELGKKLNSTSVLDLNKMAATGFGSGGSLSLSIDYEKIEDSFASALKTADLKVVLDGKVVGKIIDKQVNTSLR